MNQKLIGIVVTAFSCCAQTASLGPGFAGSDISEIISGLNSSKDKWKKSEFEKATEYAARVKGPSDPQLLRFVLSGNTNESWIDFAYNAESQTMSMTLRGLWCERLWSEDGKPDVCYVTLISKLRSSREYTAINSIGANVVVKERIIEDYGLALDSSNVAGLHAHSPTFSWKMDSDEARAKKQFLRAALYCRQVQLRLYDDVRGKEPTLDNPYNITHELFLVPVRAESLVVFDSRTGSVMAQF